MSDDIEDFLRRAAQRRQARQAGQATPPPMPRGRPEYTDARRERNVAPREDDELPGTLPEDEVAEPLARRIAELKRQQAAKQSARAADRRATVGNKTSSKRSQSGAAESARSEAAATKSPLAGGLTESVSQPPAATPAEQPVPELLELLRTPHGLRNAILLREIFDRPEHRW